MLYYLRRLVLRRFHDFLNQTEETNYLLYLLEHDYMQNLVNQGGTTSGKTVLEPAIRHLERQPEHSEILVLSSDAEQFVHWAQTFRTEPENTTFVSGLFDYSWFEGFDQAEVPAFRRRRLFYTLRRANKPPLVITTTTEYSWQPWTKKTPPESWSSCPTAY